MAVQLTIFEGSVEIAEVHKPKQDRKIPPKPVRVSKKLCRKYRTLDYIYTKLYKMLNISILEQRETIVFNNKIIAYVDEQQAEVIGTQGMNVNQRVKFYTELMGRLNG